jgi:tetratricopeptide (TPR) repeat protein
LAGGLILPGTAGQLETVQQEATAGKAAYLSGDFASAEQHYTRAIAIGDLLPSAAKITLWCNLGAACRQAKRYEAAEAAFKKAISIAVSAGLDHTPSYASMLKQYALLLRKIGQTDKANQIERQSEAALPMTTPSVGPTTTTVARFDPLAKIGGERTTRVDVSLADLMAAADKGPDDANLLRFLSRTLYENQDYAKCVHYVEKLAVLEPSSAAIQLLLCGCYLKLHQSREALESAKSAVRLSPDADSYGALIDVYTQSGDMANQLETLQQFVSRFPRDPAVPEFEKTIASLKSEVHVAERSELSTPTDAERTLCWKGRVPMPIQVFLADNTSADQVLIREDGTGARRPRELVQDALDSWTNVSGGRISFVTASDKSSAQIVIGYAREKDALMAENCATGLTQWNPDRSQAVVRLGLVGKDGYAIKRNKFLATALHEIGHALGLEHSKHSEDVMFWQEHGVDPQAPSANDQRRIVSLYSG